MRPRVSQRDLTGATEDPGQPRCGSGGWLHLKKVLKELDWTESFQLLSACLELSQ